MIFWVFFIKNLFRRNRFDEKQGLMVRRFACLDPDTIKWCSGMSKDDRKIPTTLSRINQNRS